MFSFFLLRGKKVDFSSITRYINGVLPFIVVFTVIEGLRYGRGVDYLAYARHFDFPSTITHTQDLGFDLINKFLHLLNFNSVGAFLVYAFVTIISLCVFVKAFPELKKYLFFIMLVAILPSSEWMIRQFLAISVGYAALLFLLQRNYRPFVIFTLISISIHYSNIIFFSIILLVFFYPKVIPLGVSLPLIFLLSSILPADFVLGGLGNTISHYFSMDQNSSYASYVDRSDDFISGKASNDKFKRSVVTMVINYVFYLVMFVEGYFLIKKQNLSKYRVIYNAFVVGSICFEFFITFELFKRMFQPLYWLWFIIAAFIIANKKCLKVKGAHYIIWAYVLAQMSRFVFSAELYGFVWDK